MKKSLKKNYTIKKVTYHEAMDLVVSKHYLHRKGPCSHAFGLFDRQDRMVGVITYGVSASSTLLKGICGPEESKNVYELTRLWIEDSTPKNAESFLIGNTIKLLNREIIVSFSEIQQGHVGTVYQASNFMYCGLSKKFRDPKVKGLEHQHHTSYAHGMNMAQIRDKYGDENVYYVDRPRKHRYIYFNAKGKRKKYLLDELRYKIEDYPKAPDRT
tara:strand:- start:215 stop:856 length:642 start_codon:yes stop_codon:yes gene_type:complete